MRFADNYFEIRAIFRGLSKKRALLYKRDKNEPLLGVNEWVSFLEKTYSHLEAAAHLENLLRARSGDFKIVKKALRYGVGQQDIRKVIRNNLSAHFSCAVGSACLFYDFLKHDKLPGVLRTKFEKRYGEPLSHDYRHYLADLIRSDLAAPPIRKQRLELVLMFRKTNFSPDNNCLDLETIIYNKYRRACEELGIDRTKAFFMTKQGRPLIAPRSSCTVVDRISKRGGVFRAKFHSFDEASSFASTCEVKELSKMIALGTDGPRLLRLCSVLVDDRTKIFSHGP